MRYIATLNEKEFLVEVLDERHIIVNGVSYEVDFNHVDGQPIYSAIINGQSHEAFVYPGDDFWQVLLQGRLYEACVEDERERRLRKEVDGSEEQKEIPVKAPMPGLVVSLPVGEGQAVKKGDVLLILESMKMQNELKAPRDGVVMRLRVQPGDSVEQRQNLLTLV